MESVDSPVQRTDNSPPPSPPVTPSPTPPQLLSPQSLSPLPPIRVSLPSSSGLNRPLFSTTPVLLHGPTPTHDTLRSQTYRHVYLLVYEVTATLDCVVDYVRPLSGIMFYSYGSLSIHRDYVDLTVASDHEAVSDNDSVDLPSPPNNITGLVHPVEHLLM